MTDERIIAYLLEELPEEELKQFEDECYEQMNWQDQVLPVEEDLIDAYLRDELTAEQRQRFERNYLTTEARQQRVIMAAALLRHVDECQPAQTPIAVPLTRPTWSERLNAFWSGQTLPLRAAAAFMLLAIIAGALWLFLFRTPSNQTFATLTLVISVSNNRAEGIQASNVKLPLNADALKISLTLPERLPPAPRYRIELENDRGETRQLEIVGQDARSVSVVIPATQLSRGQYALKLFMTKADGTEQRVNGSYFFTVE
jgi:methionine-rich copper-binding protein CopC